MRSHSSFFSLCLNASESLSTHTDRKHFERHEKNLRRICEESAPCCDKHCYLGLLRELPVQIEFPNRFYAPDPMKEGWRHAIAIDKDLGYSDSIVVWEHISTVSHLMHKIRPSHARHSKTELLGQEAPDIPGVDSSLTPFKLFCGLWSNKKPVLSPKHKSIPKVHKTCCQLALERPIPSNIGKLARLLIRTYTVHLALVWLTCGEDTAVCCSNGASLSWSRVRPPSASRRTLKSNI